VRGVQGRCACEGVEPEDRIMTPEDRDYWLEELEAALTWIRNNTDDIVAVHNRAAMVLEGLEEAKRGDD